MIFATNNPHKLSEIRAILGDRFHIQSMAEAGCHDDIPETADTLEGNALIKARYLYERFHTDCFADDTGLEVEALHGEPGVRSARYSGEGHDSAANIRLLLHNMQDITDRRARFRTVIALIFEGQEYLFEGRVEGEILTECHGQDGFGYDPLFRPSGYDTTFAEMTPEAKNAISHRGRATDGLMTFLQQHLP